jgi:hypothetical protein
MVIDAESWMTAEWVLAAKASLGLGLTAISVWALRTRWLAGLSGVRGAGALLALLVATRLGLFVALFGIAGARASSDVAGHYYPQARAVLAGLVPYRDFSSSYGPGFPYLAAIPVWLWDRPESLVALAIGAELASAAVWLAVARLVCDTRTTTVAATLYALSPVPLVNVAVNGQNQILVSLGLAVAAYWLLRDRAVASGVALGLTTVAVKFLAVLFAPVLVLSTRQRDRWIGGAVAVPLTVLLIGAWTGLDVLSPLRTEALLFSSGNVPYLLGVFGLDLEPPAVQAALFVGLAVVLGAVLLAAMRRVRNWQGPELVHCMTLVLVVFLLASKKAYANYLVMAFFPLCVSMALTGVTTRTTVLLGLSGTLAVLEPSVWFRWAGQRGAWEWGFLGDSWSAPGARLWAFLGIEVALLGAYAWYAWRAWLGLTRGRRLAPCARVTPRPTMRATRGPLTARRGAE